MAIVIQNVSDEFSPTGLQKYTVRINHGPILGRFEHVREEGLATCLRKAAQAVEDQANEQT